MNYRNLLKAILLVVTINYGYIAKAESYDKMWKKVSAFQQQDLPRSATNFVEKIKEKAIAEKNDAQLLKAVFVRYQLANTLSPDSGKVALQRLETWCNNEKDIATLSMLHTTLGQLYANRAWGDTTAKAKAKLHFGFVTKQLNFLSYALTRKYLPIIERGNTDAYFNKSLLPIVVKTTTQGLRQIGEKQMARQTFGQAINIYTQRTNKEAALLLRLDSINSETHNKKSFDALNKLALKNTSNKVNIETYIAMSSMKPFYPNDSLYVNDLKTGLRLYGKDKPRANVLQNALNEMECPSVKIRIEKTPLYPNSEFPLAVDIVNLKKIEISIYPVKLSAWDFDNADNKTKLKKCSSTAILQQTVFFDNNAEAWKKQIKNLPLKIQEPGIYRIVAKSGNVVASSYVSTTTLFPIAIKTNNLQSRITIVDAASGKPRTDVKLRCYRRAEESKILEAIYEPDSNGNFIIESSKTKYLYAYSDKDSACQQLKNIDYYEHQGTHEPTRASLCKIITDRTIYRPGQTIHYSLTAYQQDDETFSVLRNKQLTVRLTDVNNKQQAIDTLITNELGTCGGKFVLPENVLTGTFSLRTNNGYASINVEAYKRPTFSITLEKVTKAYSEGDTITIKGNVKSYTNLGIANARVKYCVKRSTSSWFAFQPNNIGRNIQNGEVTTDSNGHFSLNIALTKDEDNEASWMRKQLYEITTDITASNGETETASTCLYTSNQTSIIETNWPSMICKEELPIINIRNLNPSGQNIEGTGKYEVKKGKTIVAQGTFNTGKEFTPNVGNLPSGVYSFVSSIDNTINNTSDSTTTQTNEITIFSKTDQQPVSKNPLFFYRTTDAANVLLGSPVQNTTIFYEIFAKGKLLESKRLNVGNSIITVPCSYKSEYGDGAFVTVALVKNGILHNESFTIEKPEIDKKLLIRLESFRSKLHPGEKETWKLRIRTSDGKPCIAAVTAALTDASLDKFGERTWSMNTTINRYIPFYDWQYNKESSFLRQSYTKLKRLSTGEALNFGKIAQDLYQNIDAIAMPYQKRLNKKMRLAGGFEMTPDVMFSAQPSNTTNVNQETDNYEQANKNSQSISQNEKVRAIRTNFAETAFFFPSLLTNQQGEAVMNFTLPQSLTSWKFRAIAHNANMDWATTDTTVTVEKDFMLQPNLPRYFRQGDETGMTATLRNLTNHELSGKVVCKIIDPQSEKTIEEQIKSFRLVANGAQTIEFRHKASGNRKLVVCQMIASAEKFSDGEEHYIPVLSDLVTTTSSIPFSLRKSGTHVVDLTQLNTNNHNQQLSVELTANPTWYAIESLTELAKPTYDDVLSQANAYYAVCIAKNIIDKNPTIAKAAQLWTQQTNTNSNWWSKLKNKSNLKLTTFDETPWGTQALNEAQRHQRLASLLDINSLQLNKTSYIDKLKVAQLPEGAWSWYPGMHASLATTLDVVNTLTRIKSFTNHLDATAQSCLERALDYLDQMIGKEVEEAKKNKTDKFITQTQLKYLDITLTLHHKNKNISFLLNKLKQEPTTNFDIYQKALVAKILLKDNDKSNAKKLLASLCEYTVTNNDKAQYYDTQHAPRSWNAFGIPTQVAVMEALAADSSTHKETLNNMALWLIESRRTQIWDNARAAIDATNTLLLPQFSFGKSLTFPTQLPAFVLKSQSKVLAKVNATSATEANPGCIRYNYTGAQAQATTLVIEKTDNQPSWGAVFEQQTLPIEQCTKDGKELTIEVSLQTMNNGMWVNLKQETLKLGTRIRMVYKIHAQRDYNFVAVNSPRPACMEPIEILSGYKNATHSGYYRSVRDASTNFFFDQLSKGDHIITDEYFVDRLGSFRTGTTTIQCQYAPEFTGHSQNLSFSSK